MNDLHFSPWRDDFTPCWHCRHFGGMTARGAAARCGRPAGAPVRALPSRGCAFFEREPGVDDEPFAPASAPDDRAALTAAR